MNRQTDTARETKGDKHSCTKAVDRQTDRQTNRQTGHRYTYMYKQADNCTQTNR